ncbi:hypothetical protein CWR45_10290 [Oceanobacillus chungangensis]|uniref:Uncharacterized protein n=1 Tax=Oceanobacillus chungangensis TaxID=1229152 RepID=A0A3D8PQ89_9BACI|nr:hypothetical protein CWR45_10290 [Oceanobacillus chungangensis]
MLKYKFNASIITYWISCFIVFYTVTYFGIFNTDFQSTESVTGSFLIVAYLIFLGIFFFSIQFHYLFNY